MSANYEQPEYLEKRLRYFLGQFLTEQDLIDEQKYHIDRQRRSNRILQVSGICEGLTVTVQEVAKAVLTPGTALDPKGRLVVLSTSQNIDLGKYKEKEVNLVISYQEQESDLAELGKEDNGRWHEQPKIDLLSDTEDLPEGAIVLAKLKVDPDGTVTVDSAVRQYSGIYLPSGNNSSGERTGPILRSGGNSNRHLAVLTGDLTVTGNLNSGNFSLENIAISGNLTANGSVGIGTTSPEKKLDIESGEVKVKASHNNTTADIAAFLANNETAGIGIGYNRIEAIGSNANGDLEMHPKGTGQFKVFGDLVVASDKNTSLGNTNITGSVGIGTTSPEKKLDIESGEVKVKASHNNTTADIAAFLANNETAGIGIGYNRIEAIGSNANGDLEMHPKGTGQFKVLGDLVVENNGKTTLTGDLRANGKIAIGITSDDLTKVNIAQSNRTGNHPSNVKGLYVTGDFAEAANGIEFRHSNGSQGIGFGYNSIYATGSIGNQHLNLIPKGTGNVGIGTTSPTQKLQVTGGNIQLDGDRQIIFTNTDTTNNLKLQLWDGYGLGLNGGTLFYAANGRHSWRGNAGADEYMALTTSENGGLTVLGKGNSSFAGNVGIGKNNPTEKLDVSGNIKATGFIQPSAGNDETSGIMFPNNAFGGGGDRAWIQYYARQAEECTLEIGVANDSGDHIALMPSGNVGIGTTSPRAKLDVHGTIESLGLAIGNTTISESELQNLKTLATETDSSRENLQVTGTLGFGAAVRQMINLWNADYGIGIQNSTQYFRTGKNFAWYKGGSHNDDELNPGGGSVQMAIKDGHVGIGTTSPTAKLQVTGGNIQLDGDRQIIFTNTDTTNNLKLQLWDGYGLGLNGGTLFYAANGRHSWRGNAGADEYMALTTSENGGLTVLGKGNSSFAGNVGIGKNNPTEKLDVSGNIKATGFIQPSAGNDETSGIMFPKDAFGGGGDRAWIQYYARQGEECTLEIGVDNDSGDHIALMPSGNVGIGKNNPTEKLDVSGNIKATGFIQPSAGNDETSGIMFPKDAFGGGGDRAWIQYYARQGEECTLEIGVANDSGDHIALMPSGNVGIGTTSPRAKLHVHGTIESLGLAIGNTTIGEIELQKLKTIGTGTGAASSSSENLKVTGTLGFGAAVRQMINLWNADYGIGVQNATQYFRTGKNFAWYKGGSHNDRELNPGGGTMQMVIKDGNVGIGTTSPTEKLEVSGNITANGSISASSASINGNLRFSSDDRGIDFFGGARIYKQEGNGLKIQAHKDTEGIDFLKANGTTSQMVIKDGNVGIGTASPGAKLDVNGIIRAYNKDNAGAYWDNIQIWADGTSSYIQSNGDENGLRIKSNTGGKIILENEKIELPNIPRGWSGTDYLVWDRATKTIKHGTGSSLRYKEDIQPLQEDFLKILQLESKSFLYKGTNQRSFGFIAEDLHALGFQNLVSYDEEGLPEGISYPMLSVYLLEAMKRQNTQIEKLQMELDKLKKK